MIQLEVITPERRLVSEQVDGVTLPGLDGEIGVLPGHTPLVSQLQTGVLSFNRGATQNRLLVSGGFAEVTDDRVTVLADVAENAEDVDAAQARADRQNAERVLANLAAGEDETEAARTQLARANGRLQLLNE